MLYTPQIYVDKAFKNDLKNFKAQYGTMPVTQGKATYLPFGVSGGTVYDLFPQYLQWCVKNSPSLKKGVDKFATFLYGGGFENEDFGKTVVNKKGTNANALMHQVCKDLSMYKNCALLIKYNALAQICSVERLPFENIRLYEPNEFGEVEKVVRLLKYEKYRTKYDLTYLPEVYPIFNPDSETVRKQIKQSGGVYYNEKGELEMNYKGQIMYLQIGDELNDYYVAPKYLPVLQDAENEFLMSIAKKSELQNKFNAQYRVTKFGDANPDEATRARDRANYSESMGADGKTVIIEYALDREAKSDIDAIPRQDLAKSYEYVETSIERKILSMFGIPSDLISFSETSDFLGNPEKIAKQLDFLQKTELQQPQHLIATTFAKIFANWKQPIQETNFKIKNLSVI